ncbi:MAG: alginate O-acetyltransferase complex protein AlgI [Myxococcota bacterium]
MLFNAYEFVLFLVVAFWGARLLERRPAGELWWLLLASALFYASWDPRYLVLIGASVLLDFAVGRWLASEEREGARRGLLLCSLIGNLGLLGIFKYGNFALGNLEGLLGTTLPRVPGELPVGISFYTFQTLSYTIDLYRRKIRPARSLLDFATYVAFFPQLIAGPIVRASEFLPQLSERPRRDTAAMGEGIFLILAGLFKKMVLADSIARLLVDPFFQRVDLVNAVSVIVGSLSFYFQVYCDFSGYSDVAIGVGLLFGFVLPLNFDRPGIALSPVDHWRRWHVTMYNWLRDYVFISLGGSRLARWRVMINVMITFTLGGMWHGAGWNFALMGFYNGVLVAVWGRLRPRPSERPIVRLLEWALSLQLVALSILLLRLPTLADIGAVVAAMGRFSIDLPRGTSAAGFAYLALAFALHVSPRGLKERLRALFACAPPLFLAAAIVIVGAICSLYSETADAFYYFQF